MFVDTNQLSTMITHAVAPAFLLGVVAALVSILITRMTGTVDRIRSLNQIAGDDTKRIWLKDDIALLKRRETLLNHALFLAVPRRPHTVAIVEEDPSMRRSIDGRLHYGARLSWRYPRKAKTNPNNKRIVIKIPARRRCTQAGRHHGTRC